MIKSGGHIRNFIIFNNGIGGIKINPSNTNRGYFSLIVTQFGTRIMCFFVTRCTKGVTNKLQLIDNSTKNLITILGKLPLLDVT